MRRETHAAVCRLYDELWDKVPVGEDARERSAITRARQAAMERGWVPPMHWDDSPGPHYIDDPDAQPWRPEGGRDRRRIDLIADAAHQGRTVDQIAAELGVQRDTIYRSCHRAGELDLWERLTERGAA